MSSLPPLVDPAESQRRLKRTMLTFGTLIGIAVIAFVVNVTVFGVEEADDHDDVVAGDCFRNTGSSKNPHIEKLDCGDARADHQALKKVKGSISDVSCWDVKGSTGSLTQIGAESFVVCFKRNPH